MADIKIDLLPWREELREERKKEFLIVLVGVLLLAGVFAAKAERAPRSYERDSGPSGKLAHYREGVRRTREAACRPCFLYEPPASVGTLIANQKMML